MTPKTAHVAWPHAHRIVRSIYPPVALFEDIADPTDWELIAAGEARTNPRVRDEIGSIRKVPVHRRVGGPGASIVMAPFCHASPERPTRFSDGRYGVYYAGDRFAVALRETLHHFAAFNRRTREGPLTADFREYVGSVDAELHDVRDDPRFADCLDPGSYTAAQSLGSRLRRAASDGIVYPSVRCPEGNALAAFWPNVVAVPVQSRHLCYRWDGRQVTGYLVYGDDDWVSLSA